MKILLADDHVLFREGVRMVLEGLDEDNAVIEASDFSQALALVRRTPDLDLAMVDLSMPGLDGFSGLQTLRRVAPNLAVMVLSASEDAHDVRRALDCGARGYITKSSGSQLMLEGIRMVLAGGRFISPQASMATLDGAYEAMDESVLAKLTPRQLDVLSMVQKGKSNKEIARDLDIAEITVKLHVTAILRVLEVDNRTQAAIVAKTLGL